MIAPSTMITGSTLRAKMKLSSSMPNSSPKTKEVPSLVKSESFWTPSETLINAWKPTSHLSTNSAKATWRARPTPRGRQRMCLRAREKA